MRHEGREVQEIAPFSPCFYAVILSVGGAAPLESKSLP